MYICTRISVYPVGYVISKTAPWNNWIFLAGQHTRLLQIAGDNAAAAAGGRAAVAATDRMSVHAERLLNAEDTARLLREADRLGQLTEAPASRPIHVV